MEIQLAFQQIIISVVTLTVLSGCGSALIVTSEPSSAKIFIRAQGGVDRVELGQTPLEMRTSELQEKAKINSNSGEYRELIIEAEGFESQKLFLPPARFTTLETKIFAKLEPAKPAETAVGEQMVQHLFNAQQFAQASDFEKAQVELDSALKVHPKFVRALSMRGTVYYLQGNFLESLKWFEKALEVDPQYQDAVKMIAAIREKLKPAGGSQ